MADEQEGDSQVVGVDADWFEKDPSPTSRRREQPARWIPWLAPESLLCTGFFLGPAGTFLASLLVLPRRLSVRRVAFLFGTAGATWFVLQGVSVLMVNEVGDAVLRIGRTTGNLALGIGLLLFWRGQFDAEVHHSRSCLTRSAAIGAIYAALLVFLPGEWLFVLGR